MHVYIINNIKMIENEDQIQKSLEEVDNVQV